MAAGVTVIVKSNARGVADTINKIGVSLSHPQELFLQLGTAFVDDITKRIVSQDEGRWAQPSKWVRAKKSTDRALAGIEKYLHSKATDVSLEVYAQTDGEWSFTQHDQGFENLENNQVGERIQIDVVNPGPLGLPSAGPFSWIPRNGSGRTPARKIWPTEDDARRIAQPIFSRWVETQINNLGAPAPQEAL